MIRAHFTSCLLNRMGLNQSDIRNKVIQRRESNYISISLVKMSLAKDSTCRDILVINIVRMK